MHIFNLVTKYTLGGWKQVYYKISMLKYSFIEASLYSRLNLRIKDDDILLIHDAP